MRIWDSRLILRIGIFDWNTTEGDLYGKIRSSIKQGCDTIWGGIQMRNDCT